MLSQDDRLGRSGESSTKLKIIRYQLVVGAASFVPQAHLTLDEPFIPLVRRQIVVA